jgi:hypothetical protein
MLLWRKARPFLLDWNSQSDLKREASCFFCLSFSVLGCVGSGPTSLRSNASVCLAGSRVASVCDLFFAM